jgi:hypothetical protein
MHFVQFRPRSRAPAAVHACMALLWAGFAALQLNDPEPLPMLVAYGACRRCRRRAPRRWLTLAAALPRRRRRRALVALRGARRGGRRAARVA